MNKLFLRHWSLLDLSVLRGWLTDERIAAARLIDNHDGTFARAFDLRDLPAEAVVALSDTMQKVLKHGNTDSIQPLSTAPTRQLQPPPSLQGLVEQWGGYDKITAAAWKQYDHDLARWREAVRLGYAEIKP